MSTRGCTNWPSSRTAPASAAATPSSPIAPPRARISKTSRRSSRSATSAARSGSSRSASSGRWSSPSRRVDHRGSLRTAGTISRANQTRWRESTAAAGSCANVGSGRRAGCGGAVNGGLGAMGSGTTGARGGPPRAQRLSAITGTGPGSGGRGGDPNGRARRERTIAGSMSVVPPKRACASANPGRLGTDGMASALGRPESGAKGSTTALTIAGSIPVVPPKRACASASPGRAGAAGGGGSALETTDAGAKGRAIRTGSFARSNVVVAAGCGAGASCAGRDAAMLAPSAVTMICPSWAG